MKMAMSTPMASVSASATRKVSQRIFTRICGTSTERGKGLSERLLQPRIDERQVALSGHNGILLLNRCRRARDLIFEVQRNRPMKIGLSQRSEISLPTDHSLTERAVDLSPAPARLFPI